MSQPVKLSDSLVIDARQAGAALQRSIAGQVEFWARLGRAIEPLIRGDEARALSQAGPQSVAECLASVGTKQGDARLQQYLLSLPFPHYEADPEDAHLLVRVEESGQKTRGRFVNRRFIEVEGTGR